MAIKIKGSTIINDDRVLENADKIGIGTTNPHVALEIFGKVGIGTTNPDANIGLQNNTKLAVAGIVTAYEYYGTFKGDVVPETAADRIEKGNTKAQVVDNGSDGHFLVETEGVERLRINSNGEVGIGSTSPDASLDIIGTSVVGHFKSTNNDYVLRIQGNNAVDKVFFGTSNANDFLLANGDGGAGTVERLRITVDGNVGIGTNNPLGTNAVDTTNTSVLAVGIVTAREYYGTFKGTIQSAVADDRIEKGNTKAQVVDNGSDGHFLVETEGTERLRIDKDGNISFDLPTTVSNQVAITRSSILKNTTAATPRDDFYIDGDLKPISQIASTWNAYHSITRHDAADPFGPYLMLAKNRNDAYNSNTIVQDDDEFGNIAFFGNDGTKFREGARIRGEVDGTPASNQMPGALTFWTNNGTAIAEKVRITSDGDVGIGTDDPTAVVTSSNTATLAVGIVTAREYYGTFKGTIDPAVADDRIEKGNTKAQVVDNGSDGHFLVETEGTERLRITSGGLVGIGTDNPAFELHVRPPAATSSGQICAESNGNNTFAELVLKTDGGVGSLWRNSSARTNYGGANSLNIYQGAAAPIAFFTNGNNERLRITSDGNVGIGTTNPTAVVTSSNTATLAVGIVTAHEFRGGTFYGTIDTNVNTISLNANIQDVFSVSGNQLSGDDPNDDRIVFWDNTASGGKLAYLDIDDTTLEIDNTTLKVKANAVGKDYDLDFEGIDGGSGVGIATWTLSDGTTSNDDSVTLKAGSNISISNVGTSEFTIQAVQGAGVGVAASASDVLNVIGGLIGGVNPGLTTDVIVYWHEDATYSGGSGKLDHLQIGTGLKIETGSLKIDSSVVGKTYELPVTVEDGTAGSGGNSGIATLTLTDNVTPNPGEDPVTIEAGDGIVIKSITGGEGFEISADISGGGGGGISDVQVIQYSDNADPRNVRTSTNPIDVQKTVGIVTIGIGTTSNAYGNRFVGPNTPSGAIEGDIWYDTTTTGQGTNRVAVIKHVESSGTSGGQAPNTTSFNTRKLNDLNDPNGMGVTLNTNIFSLPAGTYKIDFSTPFYHTQYSQSRLKYSNQSDVVSGTLSYITGSSLYAGPGSGGETVGESDGHSVITLTETNYFILESRVTTSDNAGANSYDYGIDCNYTDEVYSQVRIEDLATAVKDDGNTNKIFQGDTKAEVNDTGSNGHFLVETEGSERLRIISDGSALFGGFTSKSASDTSNLAIKSVNSNIGILKVHSDGGEIDEDLAGISFSHGGYQNAGNSTEAARAKAAIAFESRGGASFGYGRGDLCFYVDNASDDNQVSATDEKLRITMDGDVGIGTTNPTGSNALTNNNTTLAVGTIKANNISGNPNLSIGSDEQIIFNNGSSLAGDDKFVFDHVDKKVGIGTTDPYYNLHTFFSNSATSLTGGGDGKWGGNGIRIENNNNTIGAMSLVQFRVDNADWHIGNKRITGSNPDGNSDFVFNAEGSEKLRITSTGDVGIGTTNPTGPNAVESGNTSVLAVGVVTCRELYVNGNNLSDGGANVNIGIEPPTNPSPNPGDLWWDSDNGDLHVYYKDTDNTEQWVSVNSDSSSSAPTPLSFRNLVHNGEMRIAQRIAYVSGGAITNTMGYHIDRWKAQSDYTDVTVTQAQFGSSSTDIVYQLGFSNFFRFALSAAGTANANAYLEVYQVIEGQNITSSGWDYNSSSSYITLSFWFRASTNQTFYCYLKTYDGTTYMYPFSFTASGNDTWTKITKTIPGNSNLTINTYFARGLQIVIVPFYGTTYTNNQNLNNWTTYDFNNRFPDMASTWLTAGASTFDLTGVQLEVGKTATPFEHRTYQDDLAICRRYFLNTAQGSLIFPQPNVYTSMRFPVQMRIAPSLTLTGNPGSGTQGGILSTIDGFRAYNSSGPQDFAVMANAELV